MILPFFPSCPPFPVSGSAMLSGEQINALSKKDLSKKKKKNPTVTRGVARAAIVLGLFPSMICGPMLAFFSVDPSHEFQVQG